MFIRRQFLLLLILLGVLSEVRSPFYAFNSTAVHTHSALVSLAHQAPHHTVAIIVQKTEASRQAEALVTRLEGTVTRDLSLINAFAATLPAKHVLAVASHPAVKWVSLDAPVHQSGSAPQTLRDEFNNVAYNNNDGTAVWASAWVEGGETNGPAAGHVKITQNQLRVHKEGKSLQRSANLGAATHAMLSFEMRRQNLQSADDYVALQMSPDNGASWVEVARYQGPADDSMLQPVSYDVSAYAAANTWVRFVTGPAFQHGFLFVDNVEIAYVTVDHDHLEAMNVTSLWPAPANLQGQGVTVAVVDSGISAHADLNGRILTQAVFNSTSPGPEDFYGHGTHVAGLIGGSGSYSAGTFQGVAPQVNLVDVKVLDSTGAGSTSDVIAGLQWVYENKDTYNIRVVNLSFNSSVAESYHTSPLDAAVEVLWFNEIVVVVAVGNNGNDGYLYPPANDPFVMTVGAVDNQDTAVRSDDVLASYSAYGVIDGGLAKPDLVAPGVSLISLLSGDSAMPTTHPAHLIQGPYSSRYVRLSGTSMAAAVTSGAVALLLQDEPTLNPDQVKYRLMATAAPFAGPAPGSTGAGYLDVAAAVNGTTTTTANTGVEASQLLWTGSDPVNWGSVNWSSVNWSSVNWSSVNWSSVNWSSVNWSSVRWDD